MIHQVVALRPKRSAKLHAVPTALTSANQNFPDRTDRMIALTIALRYLGASDRGLSVRIANPPPRTEPK